MSGVLNISFWTKRTLQRSVAGLAIGLMTTSFVTVPGTGPMAAWVETSITTAQADAVQECDSAFAASCQEGTDTAVKKAVKKHVTTNKRLIDKPDNSPYYTENSHDRAFNPCEYWDGRAYLGPGTVLNPHADYDGCMPQVEVNPAAFMADGSLDLGGDKHPPTTADPETSDEDWPYVPFFGGWPTGGGIPVGEILVGDPEKLFELCECDEDDDDCGDDDDDGDDDPPTDAVPLPAPALLFLTGLAGAAGIRRCQTRNA